MKKFYLLAYNVVQTVGWAVILYKTVLGLSKGLSYTDLYKSVQFEVEIFQTAAILEVVHALLGLVRSPVGTTIMQVTSRVVLVWPILHTCATSRASLGVPMLLLAWSITEVVRYAFYGLGLFNAVPYFLTWIRYTFFIVLYPTGVTGELLTLIASLPEVAEKKLYSLEMPNALNFGFSFWWILVLFAISYIPGFPQLYLYMVGQRKKIIGGGSADAQKKAK